MAQSMIKKEHSVFLRQDSSEQTLVLMCPEKGSPQLVYFGSLLPASTALESLFLSQQSSIPQAMLDHPAPLSLVPESGRGWLASPALEVSADDRATWSPCWQRKEVIESAQGFSIYLDDTLAELTLCLQIGLTAQGLLTQKITLTNDGAGQINVQRLALTMPVPAHFTKRMSFYGHLFKLVGQ